MYTLLSETSTNKIYCDDKFVYKLFDSQIYEVSMTCGYFYEQQVYNLLQTHFPDDERFVKATILTKTEAKEIDPECDNGIKIKKFEHTLFSIKECKKQYVQDLIECCEKMKSIKLMHNDLHSLNIYIEDGHIRIVDWDCAWHDSIGFNPRLVGIKKHHRVFLNFFVPDVDLRLGMMFIDSSKVSECKLKCVNLYGDEKLINALSDYKTFYGFENYIFIPKMFGGFKHFKDTCGLYYFTEKGKNIAVKQITTKDFKLCSYVNDNVKPYVFDIRKYNNVYDLKVNTFSPEIKEKIKQFLSVQDVCYKCIYLFLKSIGILEQPHDYSLILFCCESLLYNIDVDQCPEVAFGITINLILKIFLDVKIDNVVFPNNHDLEMKKLFIDMVLEKATSVDEIYETFNAIKK